MKTSDSLQEFLDRLASAAPTPGGGSAAAIMGATGAALISMVCNVTLGKKGQESVASEMKAVLDEAEKLRARLTAMMSEDIEAFDALMQAYRLPKSSDDEKMQRAAAIQVALKRATKTPLDCALACAEVIAIARRAAEHGYSGVISDAGVGVLAAQSAMRSAALNVEINVPTLQDRDFAEQAKQELTRVLEWGQRESEAVFSIVRSKLG